MSKWNLTHSMQKLMILSKMSITKGIDLRTEDTRTTTATTEEDLTEVEEEAEATEEEFRRHKNPTDSHGNTGETLSAAVLDSGATSTVCRKTWINCYEETLSDEDRLKVRNEPNSTNFKFGDG